MNTLQGIVLGNAAADIFLLLDDESVGRLVRALVYYSFHGERPAVPKPLRATFYAVYRESCRARRKNAVPPTAIPFADTPEDAQESAKAQECAIVQDCANTQESENEQKSENGQDCAIRANRAEENRIEENRIEENSPAVAGEVREAHPARAREAFEPCEDCPAPEANVRATARHIGMPDAELQSWRDYWTMREWRADPRSARPMTPAGVLASLRRWHAEEGIRAAKQAHLDAKADERALAVAAARDERRAPAVTDYDAIERAKELAWARSPVVNLDELDKLAGTAKKEA